MSLNEIRSKVYSFADDAFTNLGYGSIEDVFGPPLTAEEREPGPIGRVIRLIVVVFVGIFVASIIGTMCAPPSGNEYRPPENWSGGEEWNVLPISSIPLYNPLPEGSPNPYSEGQ